MRAVLTKSIAYQTAHNDDQSNDVRDGQRVMLGNKGQSEGDITQWNLARDGEGEGT